MRAEEEWEAGESGRLAILGIWVVAAFSLLSGRLWVLQWLHSEELGREAEKICRAEEVLPAKRGAIVDRNGVLLAASHSVYVLYADKYHLRDYQYAVSGLAVRDGMRAAEIRRKYSREGLLGEYEKYVVEVVAAGLERDRGEVEGMLASASSEAVLARGLTEEERRKLQELFSGKRVRGVHFRKETRRFYPDSRLLAHALGFVDVQGQGQGGVEKSLQKALAGVNGYRLTERDSRGRELAAFRREEQAPVRGLKVRLTVDRGLQEILEAALDRAEAAWHPVSLAVILVDPRDGQILGMASRPGFDLESKEGQERNLAVSLLYEPGSTFKLVTMAAAMDRGLLDLNTRIPLGEGSCLGDPTGDNWLTPGQVLARSSNEGIHAVGRAVGVEPLYRAVRAFGFGEATGVWLAGEAGGKIREPANWSATSLAQISMGYEVAVNPLQMLMALASVANGGLLLQPRVVQALETEQGVVVYESKRQLVRRVMEEDTASRLMEALREVVAPGGTGEAARVEGFAVAGKTGTARWYDAEAGQYRPEEVVASFVGALPVEEPQLAGIVVIERPQVDESLRSGGRTAAPLFAEIARAAADYLDLVSGPELAGRRAEL